MPRQNKRQKALFEAVAAGKVNEVRSLLAAGVDPNISGGRKSLFWNRTLLEGAINLRAGFVKQVRNLLPSENARSQRLQSEAQAFLEIIRELVRAGAQLNPRTAWESPLYIAAAAGDLEVVSLLLTAGTNPNQSCEAIVGMYGEMALHGAVCGGFVEIVEALLKSGADPKMPNYRGKTCLEALRERKKSTEIEIWERMSDKSAEVKELLISRYEAWARQRSAIEQLLERAA